MCKPVNMRVDAGRLSDKGTIDAQRCSASLLTDILFEYIYRHPTSGKSNPRGESGKRAAYDCNVTRERFRHVMRCKSKEQRMIFARSQTHLCSLILAQT